MLRKLRPRSAYDAIALLALVIAVGTGGAYAADTIGSSDIIDESIQSQDIKNGQVGWYDLANSAITSSKVKDNTLTGSDIVESSLGLVPSASTATIADAVAQGEDWHYVGDPGEPAFESGWHNYDATANHNDALWQHVAFRIDKLGVVHVRGMAAGGPNGQYVFHLPRDRCPWFFHTFPVITNNTIGRVTVQRVGGNLSCGVVVDVGNPAWVSFDGVSFQYYWGELGS